MKRPDEAVVITTYDERMAELDRLSVAGPPKRPTDALKRRQAVDYWAAHIVRLRAIYAPLPVVRRLGTGSAMPWAGTIVSDTFYGCIDDFEADMMRKRGYVVNIDLGKYWRNTEEGG